jgi:hypothetical protein
VGDNARSESRVRGAHTDSKGSRQAGREAEAGRGEGGEVGAESAN